MMPSTDKDAETYRRAAKAFEECKPGWVGHCRIDYACEALHAVGARGDECKRMKAAFAPRKDNIAWLQLKGVSEQDESQRNFRILALCFMAAMVEAGDA